MEHQPISDDEHVLRHIPGGEPWQTEVAITSANFRVRPDSDGCSVSRERITGAKRLLELRSTAPHSRIAAARVGEIRKAGLDVIPDETADDPGHALIVSRTSDLRKKSVAQQLKRLFVLLPNP